MLPACMNVDHICAWCLGGQKKALDSLELEVQNSL